MARVTGSQEDRNAEIASAVGRSASVRSRNSSPLEDAGYITIERPLSDHRRRVRARLTALGRERYAGHVAALRKIIAEAPAAT